MTWPLTGGTYAQTREPGIDPTAARKALLTDIYIRDYHSASTDLSDASVGLNPNGHFTPYAQDGLVRTDLLITATGSNLGFHHVGGLSEEGITYTPSVDTAETMYEQSIRPVRYDITKETDAVEFVIRQQGPLVDVLRDDLPLSALQDKGAAHYSQAKPAFANLVERQIIALYTDGLYEVARVMPRCIRTDVAASSWNRNDSDDAGFTYEALLCPFAGYAVLTLREGEGWRGSGGYPVFGVLAPVALQTGATTATVTHAIPSGEGNPWTYEVEKSVSPFTTWTTAAVATSVETAGNVTHSITGLTSATQYKFRVTATGTNLLEATSQVSNTVTTA